MVRGPPVVRDHHSAWWSASKGYRPLGPTFLFFNAINKDQFWQFSMAQFSAVIRNREKIFLIKWSSSLKRLKTADRDYVTSGIRTLPRTFPQNISQDIDQLYST